MEAKLRRLERLIQPIVEARRERERLKGRDQLFIKWWLIDEPRVERSPLLEGRANETIRLLWADALAAQEKGEDVDLDDIQTWADAIATDAERRAIRVISFADAKDGRPVEPGDEPTEYEETELTTAEAYERLETRVNIEPDAQRAPTASRAPRTNEAAPSEPEASESSRKKPRFGAIRHGVRSERTKINGTTAWISEGHRDLAVPTNFDSVEMPR